MCDARNVGLTEGETIKMTASHGKPAVNGLWGILKYEVWNTLFIYRRCIRCRMPSFQQRSN